MSDHPPVSIFLRFLHYTGAGAIGTLAHYFILIVLKETLGINVHFSTAFGFMVGAVVNYQINRRITFRDSIPQSFAFARFLIIATVGGLINSLVVWLLLDNLRLHYLLAQVAATGVVLFWGFFANMIWTFRRPKSAGSARP